MTVAAGTAEHGGGGAGPARDLDASARAPGAALELVVDDAPLHAAGEWSLRGALAGSEDPLRGCLPLLAGLYGRPASAEALTAGLTLEPGRLTPEDFIRALARTGLRGRLVKRPLARIGRLSLPCVVLLEGQGACILTDVVAAADGSDAAVDILLPEFGAEPQRVPFDALAREYHGYAILAQMIPSAEWRAETVAGEDPRGWFRRAVLRCWPLYLEAAIATALANLLLFALPLAAMHAVDEVLPNPVDAHTWIVSSGAALALVFVFVLTTLRRYFLDVAASAVDADVGARVFRQLVAARPSHARAGVRLAGRLEGLREVRQFLASSALSGLFDAPFAVAFLAALALIAPGLLPAALAAVAGVLATLLLASMAAVRVADRAASEADLARDIVHDAVAAQETVKSRVAEGRTLGLWERVARHGARSRMRLAVAGLVAEQIGWLAPVAAGLAVATVAVGEMQAAALDAGAAAAGIVLSMLAIGRITPLFATVAANAHARTAIARLDDVMRAPAERPQDPAYVARPPAQGTIELREVSVRFPGTDAPALRDVTLRIGARERVAIVGPAGAGKSTLARLLLGFVAPSSGAVFFDGIELARLDPADVRAHIGYAGDDPVLVSGTVADNIRLGRPLADADCIERALRIAGADDLLTRLPQGLETPVGERGTRLSPGERRAVSLAGALVGDPPLLLLDEPCAWMDERAEGRFKARLSASLGGGTLLLLTRRRALLSMVDRLIVLDRGRIVADGPVDHVLRRVSPRLVDWSRS